MLFLVLLLLKWRVHLEICNLELHLSGSTNLSPVLLFLWGGGWAYHVNLGPSALLILGCVAPKSLLFSSPLGPKQGSAQADRACGIL